MPFVATRRALLTPGAAAAAGGDWWTVAGQTCVAAYQPIGAASLAASYVNLANPGTYDCTYAGTGLTWDASYGWDFSAANQGINTGYNLTHGQISIIARFSDVTLVNYPAVFGTYYSNTNRYYHGVYNNADYYAFISDLANSGNIAGAVSGGVIAQVEGPTTGRGYYNGSSVGNSWNTPNNGVTILAPITIGNIYNTSTSQWIAKLGGRVQALAMYSTPLSAADNATQYTKMAALT